MDERVKSARIFPMIFMKIDTVLLFLLILFLVCSAVLLRKATPYSLQQEMEKGGILHTLYDSH